MTSGIKDLSPEILSQRRLEAVRLRLDGLTVAETAARTGLSAPTVSAAWKAFRQGGWDAVPVRQRGRKTGQTETLDETVQGALRDLLVSHPDTPDPAWSRRALANALGSEGHKVSPRAVEHWLEAQRLKPEPMALEGLERKRSTAGRWYRQQVQPLLEQVQQAGGVVWQGGARVARPPDIAATLPARYQLYLHGKRGALYTRCLPAPPEAEDYLELFRRLLAQAGSGHPVALVFHGAFLQASPEVQAWLVDHPDFHLINVPPDAALVSPARAR